MQDFLISFSKQIENWIDSLIKKENKKIFDLKKFDAKKTIELHKYKKIMISLNSNSHNKESMMSWIDFSLKDISKKYKIPSDIKNKWIAINISK